MSAGLLKMLRDWRGRSLANAFTLPAILIAIVSSMLVASVSLAVIYRSDQTALKSRLQTKSDRLAERIRDSIGIVESATFDIAKNPLFIAALLDSRGRDTYVAPYLENYTFPITTVTGMALCDANGEKLAAMRSFISQCSPESTGFKIALDSGKTHRELNTLPDGVVAWVVYHPVMHPYTGLADGLVVAKIDLNDLLRTLPRDLDLEHASLQRMDGSAMLASAGAKGADETSFKTASSPLYKDSAPALPFEISVLATDSYTYFDGKLAQLFVGYLFGCALLVLGIVYLMRNISARLIKPLTELTGISRSIAESGDLNIEIPQKQGGEVGELAGALGVMVQTLRDSEAELEHKVELRTSELRASEAAAAAASQAKSQFLANMSHEIRTPMNAILGLLNLLQGTELTSRQRDYASKTEGAAQSLLGILNDILDFSKVEAGKMTLESEPFHLDKLMRNLSVVLSANVGSKNIEVLFDIDPDLPSVVRGDVMRLQQVLINLAGNAVKFTSEGQVVISIRLLAQAAYKATIAFAVQDTGIGIAPEHHAHIFSGFSQAEGSTTRRFGGTGLGLVISKRFVELMGGDIQITSAQGVGSTFAFTLEMPTVDVSSELQGESQTPLQPGTATSLRVLVVDDNPIAAELTLRMLRSWGWMAELAKSGKEAVERISGLCTSATAEFPFPMIYMDWKMPEMDGWETTRQIRELAHRHKLTQPTVIMLTAHGRDMLSQRTGAEQEQINGFLVKPATASMLFDVWMDAQSGNAGIRKITKGRSSTRQLNGMRILVVEDNLINQQVAEELLSTQGAIVSLAANGRLGVDAVAAAAPQFDVVLMDVQMPVMDGYGATRAIREDLHLKSLPIIAMTANAMASDREACLAAGMNEHIGKPFEMAKLVSLLIRMTGFHSHVDSSDMSGASSPSSAPNPVVPEVAGLDIHTALTRMSGMRSLYVRTAKDFVKIMDTAVPELQQCLNAGDKQQAMMRLHTLKGNAGTLGAMEMAAQAATLEKMCNSSAGMAECEAALAQFQVLVRDTQGKMHEAIALLGEKEASNTQATAKPPFTGVAGEAARKALHHIAALAKAADLEVLQAFAETRDLLNEFPAESMDALDDALQCLDLETAAKICHQMLSSISG